MQSKVTPKDFFLWFGAMAALYTVAFSLGSLLFSYIDFSFPDALEYYVDPYSGGMRFAMASLIVVLPTLILLMRAIRRDITRDPSRRDVWVRRWALYLTLFLAGVAVLADLIALINSFLGGDLTTRFILKVLTVFAIASFVFARMYAELRGYWDSNPGREKLMQGGAAFAVAVAILSGFFILGSPSQVRLYRFDDQKVMDLQNVQWQIVNFWQQKERLPDPLIEIADPISGFTLPVDPQPPLAYTYRKNGDRSFELCATFNRESQRNAAVRPAYPGNENENWQHGAGEHCFERTIDPERYPPYPKGGRLIE